MAEIQSGDAVPVIICRHCEHTVQLLAVPSDDQGQPYQSFHHECPKCKKGDQYQLSEIQIAKAHRKQ